MRAFILFLTLFFGQAALAQTLEENVRAALVAADTDQLETLIDAAQSTALATGNHEDIRFVYRRIFATTNPGYEATIRDWVTQHPRSAYAWAALGEMQFWQALAYRVCYCYMRGGPKPLGDGFVELLPQAQLSALRAHDLDPAFVRATVLALKTYNYGMSGFSIEDIAEETLKVAPDRRVVVEAATSAHGRDLTDFAKAYATCARYAPYIAGYTADQCAIEVVLTSNSDLEVRQAARDAIMADPSPFYDQFRVKAAIHAALVPEQVATLIAIHNAQITEVSDLADWLSDAQDIGFAANNLFYNEEAQQLAVAEAKKRLQDDPRNPWLALMLIDQVVSDPSLPPDLPPGQVSVERYTAVHEQKKALWRAALPFGYQSGQFWLEGMSADVDLILNKPSGAPAAIPYIENALVLTGHNPHTVITSFERLVWAAYDGGFAYDRPTDTSSFETDSGDLPPEAVRCTLGRLARMLEYVCTTNTPYTTLCQNNRPGDEVKDVLLKLEEPAYCPSVLAMSPSQLAFTELRAIPGFDPATYDGPASAP
jgi:hypothetical protein